VARQSRATQNWDLIKQQIPKFEEWISAARCAADDFTLASNLRRNTNSI
jgi:hypothetical protein